MNVLLIHPPSKYPISLPLPKIFTEVKKYPPLGLLYIASSLEQLSKFKIHILDLNISFRPFKRLLLELSRFNPEIIGIQTYTYSLFDVQELCRIIKEFNNRIHINLGGPHLNLYPQETLQLPFVDSITIGEGEHTFSDLIVRLSQNRDLSQINGLSYKSNNQTYHNPSRIPLKDIDILPFPNRIYLKPWPYFSFLDDNVPFATMIAGRGCPFKCIFCGVGGNIHRSRSPLNIIDEIQICLASGFKYIEFMDDTFYLNSNDIIDLCKIIIDKKLQFKWAFRGRVDLIDANILTHVKAAGCIRIFFGVESGNAEILKFINKGVTLDQIFSTFSLCRKFGIQTIGYFMIGFPFEIKNQIEQTISLAKKLNPNYAQFSILIPTPKTPLSDWLKLNGLFFNEHLIEYARRPRKNFSIHPSSTIFTESQLKYFLLKAYRIFYFRLSFFLQLFKSIRSLSQFVIRIKAGWYTFRY